MTIVCYGAKEIPVRALLDPGASGPVMSEDLVKRWNIPHTVRTIPKPLEAFNTTINLDSGKTYSKEVVLRHQAEHFSRISFEISPLDQECDILLPYWWLQQHQPDHLWDPDTTKVAFTSDYCRQNCTSFAVLGKKSSIASVMASYISKIPERFRMFAPLASPEMAQRLPDHQPWDHVIDIIGDEKLPWGPIYPMSPLEKKILRKWLDQMLQEGKIRESKSSCSSPIFFVDKDASMEKAATRDPENLRPVVDYRKINERTVKNRHPLPLITELQDALFGSIIFTKIDLKSGFNLIRMKKGHEWKTAFRTCYGLFEFNVMSFGLTNAPAAFQGMINHIFRDLIDQGLLSYIDDLLIYASSKEEHDKIVIEVLKRLQKYNLAINPSKCVWDAEELEYLGYIISAKGIAMSKDKVECILSWKQPKSVKGVQQFNGFANFYRRYIKGYSRIAKPLTDSTNLTQKSWQWTKQMNAAFDALKKAFTEAPVLAYFDPSKPPIIEPDASDYALGSIMSQKQDDGRIHPVAFHSRKLIPAEMNYEIHDKELLAIVDSFQRWRHYLEGAKYRIEVFSDHRNLEYFQTAKVLNRRQARWAQQLATFDFVINFRPGTQNAKADALSRREEYLPEGGDENQPITSVLNKGHFSHSEVPTFMLSKARLCSIPTPKWNEEFFEQIKSAAPTDETYQKALVSPGKDVTNEDGILFVKNRIWIPDNKELKIQIIRSEHDTKVAGHMGMDKTVELIRRHMFWQNLEKDVAEFVRSCHECQGNKPRRHLPFGLLNPIELEYSPWRLISMDFITDLPLSNGCSSIWVIVDTFTKMAHFIPLKDDAKKTEDLIPLFARECWKYHGMPSGIISDRDSRFNAGLWRDFLKHVGVKPRMSTSFHPETDGQTERLNQHIEAYLRAFVNYEMNNWDTLLPTAEFAWNNARSTSTGSSPFYANYGYHPAANNPPDESARNPHSEIMAHWMTTVYENLCETLKESRERMKKYADRKRTEAPSFAEKQLVMLDARNIKTKRPSKKLDKKLLGPFKISKVVSPTAVKLELPERWKIHPTFHVSLIEPFRTGSQPIPDPIQVLEQVGDVYPEEFVVEEIMNSRTKKRIVEYLVKWDGYPEEKDWTWEPYEHFSDIQELWDFHVKHPRKPKDPRVINPGTRGESS